ncbi:endolytic transglycosylase MltG [Notoacmeibacter ruber]|uniref:Endolytic murein transglycosylase n=1 Tax=Notoacmeibacter ruber TaxID=2670375 RepID=A0A3L7JB74_9HYPH|nr:endolytic transglycosylase MltG [Notoacmeibacter ruber]RLQ87635.1 endolytic transglycosylase MltG [Notoacmeibacter ruber]
MNETEGPSSTSQPVTEEAAVPDRRRSRTARNQFVIFFNFLFTIAVLAVIGIGGLIWYSLEVFDRPSDRSRPTLFAVEPGTGLSTIANNLAERGLISDAQVFKIATRAYGLDGSLKAGEYEIPPQASMRDILQMMQRGDVLEYRVTVPEGWTTHQALARIESNDALSGDMPEETPAEGSLIADTIVFQRGLARQTLVEDMQQRQSELVQRIWAERDEELPIETVEEFVTLASIVEKETGVPEERPEVAAVFINRLRQGMRLQSDPTIIYGLFGGEGKPADRPIYRSDITKETPYNTYVINGLPPGPIATPGRDALEAVAHPAETDALYFVADGTGGHAFAATLEEHNANVRAWRELEADRGIPTEERGPVQGDDPVPGE